MDSFSFFSHACMPAQLCFAVTHTDQKPLGHAAWGCHGNPNTQRLQRSLCFIKWLQGFAKTHVGVLEQRRLDAAWMLFAERPSQSFFWKMETNRSEQGCRVSPPRSWTQTQTQQSFPLSPAVLDTFVGKAGGCRRLVKTWSRQPRNPDFCLCLSITLLSSSLIKKEKASSCLCWAVHFFHVICPVATTL